MTLRRSLFSALLALPVHSVGAQVAWSDITSQPHPEWISTACYDPLHHTIVVFRHFGGTMTVSEFDGTTWTIELQNNFPPFSALAGGASAYDPARDVFVITTTNDNFQLQTLEWDRTTWTLRNVTATPGGMTSLAWHAGRGTVVGMALLGLGGSNSSVRIYEWTGTNWVQRTSRAMQVDTASMAYDAVANDLVVLARSDGQNVTFRVDMSTWQQVPHPTLGEHHVVLAPDHVHGRMFGFANTHAQTTYELTPAGWERHRHGTKPPYNAGYGVAFLHLPPLDAFVLVQNQPYQPTRCGTYLYRPAEHEAPTFGLHHPGCPGTSTPTIGLASASSPVLGQSYGIEVGEFSATSLFVFLTTGFDDGIYQNNPLPYEMSPLGLPGCYLNVACEVTDAAMPQGGLVLFEPLLPLNLDFIGLRFFHQALVVDPPMPNALGGTVTDSMTGTVGW